MDTTTALPISPVIAEYTISSNYMDLAGAITSGPDGALWFTQPLNSKIGRMTTSGVVTNEYSITAGAGANSITSGPDGALWFTEGAGASSAIGRITTDGTITTYPTPTAGSIPEGITTGSDGALWFVEGNIPKIGRITTDGTITEYNVPGASASGSLLDITSGQDGALWFEEFYQNKIGRISTDGTITEYQAPAGTYPDNIITGQDGALWFTANSSGNAIGRMSTTGVFSFYQAPNSGEYFRRITSGPDGNIWYTASENNFNNSVIGSISTSGDYGSEIQLPSVAVSQLAANITSGPDGNLWFTQSPQDISKPALIGQVLLNPPLIPSSPTGLSAQSAVTNSAPVLSWNVVTGATSYNLYRQGPNTTTYIEIGSSTSNLFTDNNPNNIPTEGSNRYYVTAVNVSGESSPSNVVSVVVDRTAPTVSNASWTTNPIPIGSNTTLSVAVADNLSGVAGGEYFVGADPGIGNGVSMALNSGNLTSSLGSNLATGVYNIGVRAEDSAGNWSPVSTTMLAVYNPSTTLGVTGKNKKDLIPSLANSDVLPGLVSNTQTDAADYGISVAYKNGVIDTRSAFNFTYTTGTNCKKANAINCHSFILNSTSIAWLALDMANNSRAIFQGVAAVVADGVTTTNTFTVEAIDGDLLTTSVNDSLVLKVYAPGADPNYATPLYQATGSMPKGNSVVIK